MREFKDGEPAGGTDPLTRVDFWKRERVPEPPADHKTAGRARRRLAGSVSLDRIVAASPGPAAPQAAPRDAEQAITSGNSREARRWIGASLMLPS